MRDYFDDAVAAVIDAVVIDEPTERGVTGHRNRSASVACMTFQCANELPPVDQVVAVLRRKYRLQAVDADDLRQDVHLLLWLYQEAGHFAENASAEARQQQMLRFCRTVGTRLCVDAWRQRERRRFADESEIDRQYARDESLRAQVQEAEERLLHSGPQAALLLQLLRAGHTKKEAQAQLGTSRGQFDVLMDVVAGALAACCQQANTRKRGRRTPGGCT